MALIKCKECGKQVSDTCQSCPHCGADIQQQIFDSLSPEEQKAFLAPEENTWKFMFIFPCILLIGAIGSFYYDSPGIGILLLIVCAVLVYVLIGKKNGKFE